MIWSLSIISDRMFTENATADQEEIAAYENLLKTIPQIQTIITNDVSDTLNCLIVSFIFSLWSNK